MRRLLAVLLLFAVAVLVLVAGSRWLSAPSGRVVYVAMPTGYGVRAGMPVLFRGVEIGHVDSVGVGRAGVRLRLRLRGDEPLLRRRDRVRVKPIGIFGDAALVIDPGPDTAAVLPVGEALEGRAADTLSERDLTRADSLLRETLRRGADRDSSPPKR